MHRRGAANAETLSNSQAVVTNRVAPGIVTLVGGFELQVAEQMRQHLVIFRSFDGVFLHPGDARSGLLHFCREAVTHPDRTHRRMIHYGRHFLVFADLRLHLDVHIRRKLKRVGELLEIVEADTAVVDVLGLLRFEVFGNDLVKWPAFGAMNVLDTHPGIFLRQCTGHGVSIMPQIEPRHPWNDVDGLPLEDGRNSLAMVHVRFLRIRISFLRSK